MTEIFTVGAFPTIIMYTSEIFIKIIDHPWKLLACLKNKVYMLALYF